MLRRLYPDACTYILDSKVAGDFNGYGGRLDSERAPAPLHTPGAIQVWQPPTDDKREYDNWLGGILKRRRPAIVLIDELSSLGNNTGQSYVSNFARIQKQGRGLGICTITLTQELAYIPRQVHGQMTHFVRFALHDEHDQKAAAKHLGQSEPREPRKQHGFFYVNVTRLPRTAIEYDGYDDFF